MATSLPPVKLEPNVWKDLYDATSITIGVQLIIQNNGKDEARLSESLAEPISSTGSNNIKKDKYLTSATTPIGVWAKSRLGTILQVEEV